MKYFLLTENDTEAICPLVVWLKDIQAMLDLLEKYRELILLNNLKGIIIELPEFIEFLDAESSDLIISQEKMDFSKVESFYHSSQELCIYPHSFTIRTNDENDIKHWTYIHEGNLKELKQIKNDKKGYFLMN